MVKQYPKVAVGCFILNDQQEILLVKSYKWPGFWVVMGGHVELGETIAQTVVREAKEEIGLSVKFVRIIEVVEFVYDPAFHDHKHFIGLQCQCHLTGHPIPHIDHDEIQEARWFPLSEAIKLKDVLPVTHQTLTKLAN
ncbi:MAG: NUDIX hydrolase [Microgenomates group bacterium GW2011_GWA2_46_7]|nr:MAG: NUDIX hydrolase [Microgenomates group bacterium GW2011_GWC2_46_7]KKU46821.1 MAG: NUDIX hydrolase [Microgenomates group bacterium GW2011_GWA2_46_7]